MRSFFLFTVLAGILVVGCQDDNVSDSPNDSIKIAISSASSFQEKLAAKEIRRYLYLRTGKLPEITRSDKLPSGTDLIIIGQKDQKIVKVLAASSDDFNTSVTSLESQEYRIKTLPAGQNKHILIAGGDNVGALYGAYRFCEHLGVRFFLHGDVIPEQAGKFNLAALDDLDETGKPLFGLRGLNPWGTHPFGFDLWNEDDYKSVFSQLAKMRMNFMGLHCYPEGIPYAEPTVWIGQKDDFDSNGDVSYSYPSVYYNTGWKANWGPIYPKNTSEFSFGGSLLFEADQWGPDVLTGYTPRPETEEACNTVFNRTGKMFKNSFSLANQLGVKTCIGTEAPLTIPQRVKDRLKQQGKDPESIEVKREIYEGIFQRIAATHPLDYYWIWTSENWIWGSNTNEQSSNVSSDMEIAYQALKDVNASFGLATAGWVLGPAEDRAGFDKVLPKDIAMSAISRRLGHEPVDPAFNEIKGRQKWAIPWMEGDLGMANPQLWVSRTRRDAAEALAYGCTGLMGLHWRTRIMGPNISALAQAGWDQSGWNVNPGSLPKQQDLITPESLVDEDEFPEGAIGGVANNYPDNEIADTQDDEIYQSCRYALEGYNFTVPNGNYTVTLKFCEPHFNSAGKRIFNVKLQGKTVLEKLDVFAVAGKFKAMDKKYDNVKVDDGTIKLRFEAVESLPFISAIVIEGDQLIRKINCGGRKYQDYLGDYISTTQIAWGEPRGGLSNDDFFDDWAIAMFGPQAGPEAAAIFKKLDGSLPRPAVNGCPCGILPDHRKWKSVSGEYAFIRDMEQLRDKVESAGNLERFDYWLNTFRHLRGLAKVQCDLGSLQEVMDKIKELEDRDKKKALALQKAVPLYRNLLETYQKTYSYLLASITTNGGLSNVINLEQGTNFWHRVIKKPYEKLSEILKEDLPDDLDAGKEYAGRPRMFVPTVRTLLLPDETLKLKVIIIDNDRPKHSEVFWRKMGSSGAFESIPLNHIERGVYNITFPEMTEDFEYYVQAVISDNETLYFPPAGPQMPQTVVVME